MPFYKKDTYRCSLTILGILFLSGCIITPKNDVYSLVQKGSSLTIDILKHSDQIIPYNSDLILVYDISDNPEYSDLHLLFFNSDLKLYAATYFPSKKIESVKDYQINSYLNEERNKRAFQYRNELPIQYTLNFNQSEKGYSRRSNKSVKNINLNPEANKVTLVVSASEDPYYGLYALRFKEKLEDSVYLRKFQDIDTLSFFIGDINIDYEESVIELTDSKFAIDYLLIPKKGLLNDFFREYFKRKLNKKGIDN